RAGRSDGARRAACCSPGSVGARDARCRSRIDPPGNQAFRIARVVFRFRARAQRTAAAVVLIRDARAVALAFPSSSGATCHLRTEPSPVTVRHGGTPEPPPFELV